MKKLILIASLFLSIGANAQVDKFVASAGIADVPVHNFTFKEAVSGETRSLHTPLNQGKFVVGYYGAYWCGHCHTNVINGFNSTLLKKVLAEYPNRVEFWADIYDGNNGTTAQNKASKTWGSEVFAFYAGNGFMKTPFSCINNPGYLIIEPSTKKLVYMVNGDPTETLSVLRQLLNGTYKNPNLTNNIALRKKVTSNSPYAEFWEPNALTDGLDGTKFQSAWQENIEFTLDLAGKASITEVVLKSDFDSGVNFKLSISDYENGPWKQFASVGIPTNRNLSTFSNLNEKGRFIRFERANGKIQSTEIIVRGAMENPTANDDVTLENFKLYPNPSKGIINITLPNAVSEINVLDVMGRVVYQQIISEQKAGEQKLDLSSLEKGIYFVKIKGAKTLIRKILMD